MGSDGTPTIDAQRDHSRPAGESLCFADPRCIRAARGDARGPPQSRPLQPPEWDRISLGKFCAVYSTNEARLRRREPPGTRIWAVARANGSSCTSITSQGFAECAPEWAGVVEEERGVPAHIRGYRFNLLTRVGEQLDLRAAGVPTACSSADATSTPNSRGARAPAPAIGPMAALCDTRPVPAPDLLVGSSSNHNLVCAGLRPRGLPRLGRVKRRYHLIMSPALTTSLPLVLAAVMIASAVAKFRRPDDIAGWAEMGVPRRLRQRWLITFHPWGELLLGIALAALGGVLGLLAAVVALALMVAYLSLVSSVFRRAQGASCACFGTRPRPVTRLTIARNAWLTLLAAATVMVDLGQPAPRRCRRRCGRDRMGVAGRYGGRSRDGHAHRVAGNPPLRPHSLRPRTLHRPMARRTWTISACERRRSPSHSATVRRSTFARWPPLVRSSSSASLRDLRSLRAGDRELQRDGVRSSLRSRFEGREPAVAGHAVRADRHAADGRLGDPRLLRAAAGLAQAAEPGPDLRLVGGRG